MVIKINEIDYSLYNLLKEKKTLSFEEINSALDIEIDSLRRALEFLKSEEVISEKVDEIITYSLTEIGAISLKNGFIEEIFCDFIKDKEVLVSSLKSLDIPNLEKEEISLAFGISKRNNLILIEQGKIVPTKDYKEKIDSKKNDLNLIVSGKETSQEKINDFLQRKFIIKKITLEKEYSFLKEKDYAVDKDTIINLTSEILK